MEKQICFVVFGFPHISETFVVNQIVAAIDHGYQIKILPTELLSCEDTSQLELMNRYQLRDKCLPAPYVPDSVTARIPLALKILLKSSPRYYLPLLRTINPFVFGHMGLDLSIFFQVVRFTGVKDEELFHAQFGPNGIALANAKMLGVIKGKIITTFHGFDAHYTEHNLERLRKYYRNLFAIGDCFTANTKYLADQLIALQCPPEKIKLIPMGVDVEYFSPDPSLKNDDGKFRLLSVGRLVEWKGHHLGIQVVKKLIDAGYPVEYTIIGDGERSETLEQLIQDLEVGSHVFMTGSLDQEEVRRYMRASDIFFMTSVHDETGRREAQGVVSAEAQACGLPVVAFQSGGVPYTMRNGVTGLLVKEGDVEAFYYAATVLLKDAQKRREMGINAREFIRDHYSLAHGCDQFMDLYDEVANVK